ncbi:class II aldolase/adducin family protein [Candidatus Gracilibacteria bacterium]|jgi:L-ribulose-5-phosphate 4-epimerase|nr:class II aldolase/adducin family protein [Candidatus Gracilibacteria bacterium]NJM89172.1 class II aldolase/adducin family protein [Hydrococcus sp. RU_2_2]NJP21987.1 class II aldolase/adducin family protein [Hydrococcus sp. CRU_1_1]
MFDEGYVKYQCNWLDAPPFSFEAIQELNRWRDKLYHLGLIGQYNNGIGFGNLSIRCQEDRTCFIISGTKTGGLPALNERHYTKVIDYNWEENYVTCLGPIQASSEALTHAAIYEANPRIDVVIHVHHLDLWRNLMDKVPTTAKNIAYGTPEMAREIIRLCREDNLGETQILVMSGHEEGIITFGRNLDEAGNLLLKYYYLLFVKN